MTTGLAVAVTLGDVELMQRVQADDPDAFEVLYDRFRSRAYRLAVTIAGDKTRAEDIVQEAFVSLWMARALYHPERGAVTSWVMATVRNRAFDSVRRQGRHDSRRADGDQLGERTPAAGDVEETAIERDQAASLRNALARLPEAQREVIVFAYFGELSANEIADQLALPPGTVKGRMRLGLEKLRTDQHAGSRRVATAPKDSRTHAKDSRT